ncbi:MAG: orotidine 5'-phosphate decarboxylase [Nanoarchaeota archaeon]|nr:orotidine 5'-phosphate decarboxylase [Nanoarchaeota archaeon]MBU4086175.1 orotidine 5'-phosphate decarboxylase [Nanoarchaeota archaeon]
MKSLKESWLSAVDKKNSIVCAGMDPAEYLMGRTEKGEGLPAGKEKRHWALDYLEAIAPFCAAVKPNLRYWGGGRDLMVVEEIVNVAKGLGLVVIQDSKEADIGSTNDSGIFYAALRGCDAVTLAAFAGNMEEASKQAKDRRIDLISMCLMSNPEYERVKNMWVRVSNEAQPYDANHIMMADGLPHVRHYIQLAHDAAKFGLGGIVIGAPSSKNHLKDEEVANAAHYFKDGLVLVPGIGAQGGEVPILAKHFAANRLICNIGRGLMFPNGANSTPQQQTAAAKQYQEMLNQLRAA